jgi:hypothetical protein
VLGRVAAGLDVELSSLLDAAAAGGPAALRAALHARIDRLGEAELTRLVRVLERYAADGRPLATTSRPLRRSKAA